MVFAPTVLWILLAVVEETHSTHFLRVMPRLFVPWVTLSLTSPLDGIWPSCVAVPDCSLKGKGEGPGVDTEWVQVDVLKAEESRGGETP